MSKMILTVVGDSNDADYETSTHTYEPSEILLTPDSLKTFNKGCTHQYFYEALGRGLKRLRLAQGANRSHNWARDEYGDNLGDRLPLCFAVLQEIHLWTLDTITFEDVMEYVDDEEQYPVGSMASLLQNCFHDIAFLEEVISDLAPYGEYGVHTISEVSYAPLESKTVLYDSDHYRYLGWLCIKIEGPGMVSIVRDDYKHNEEYDFVVRPFVSEVIIHEGVVTQWLHTKTSWRDNVMHPGKEFDVFEIYDESIPYPSRRKLDAVQTVEEFMALPGQRLKDYKAA